MIRGRGRGTSASERGSQLRSQVRQGVAHGEIPGGRFAKDSGWKSFSP